MNKDHVLSRRQARDQKIRTENIEKILSGSEKVFAEKGYEGARMADLADASGLAKANLYYYFGTKEAIYQNVIEELLAKWDMAFHHISADKAPGLAIADYIRAKVEYSQKHPEASKIFAKEIIGGSRFLSKAKMRAIRVITRQKVKVIEKWIDDGEMAPIDPYHFFFLLWGATQYYAEFDAHIKNVLEKPQLDAETYDAAIRTITHIVLAGCGIKH